MEINRLKRKSLTNIHTKTHRHTTHTRTHTHYDRDFTILLNNLIFYLFASQFQLTVDTSKQITRLKYNIALVLLNSADGRFVDVCGFFRHEKKKISICLCRKFIQTLGVFLAFFKIRSQYQTLHIALQCITDRNLRNCEYLSFNLSLNRRHITII